MPYPAPRTCQLISGLTAIGLVVVDLACLAMRRPMPNVHLHQVAVGAAAALGAVGVIGSYLHESLQLGRRLEQTRQTHRPAATVTPLTQRRPSPRRRLDP